MKLIAQYWSKQYTKYRAIYHISPLFRFNGNGIIFYQEGEIECGENSYIGENSSIQAVKGCKVKIGNNCSISHYVNIYTSNHYADKDFSINDRTKNGNVTIGDNCWIGIKASIMGPVNIGENVVVGANSLVNRDLPPHSIAIGVPAQVIKFKSYLADDTKIRLALEFRNVLSDGLKKELDIIDE